MLSVGCERPVDAAKRRPGPRQRAIGSCCGVQADADSNRFADGTAVDSEDVLQICRAGERRGRAREDEHEAVKCDFTSAPFWA
jgi:hypothetical protein